MYGVYWDSGEGESKDPVDTPAQSPPGKAGNRSPRGSPVPGHRPYTPSSKVFERVKDDDHKHRGRSLSSSSSDDEEVVGAVVHIRTPVKEHHATYKTPRRDLSQAAEAKGEGRDGKDSKDIADGAAVAGGAGLESRVKEYLSLADEEASLASVRGAMEAAGEDRATVLQVLQLLDELQLKDSLDDQSPARVPLGRGRLEEAMSLANLWHMGRFNAVWGSSGADEGDEGDASGVKAPVAVSSPRRKLIMYNVSISLSQLRQLGRVEDVLSAVCALDTWRGRITTEHLRALLHMLPEDPADIHAANRLDHPAEDFLQVAATYYPSLPRRVQVCLLCSQFPSELSRVRSACRAAVDACNEVPHIVVDYLALL